MTPPAPITRSGAQRDAHRELSKAIYQHGEPWTTAVLRWLGRHLDNAVSAAGHSTLGLTVLALLVVGAAVALAAQRGGLRRTAAAGAVFPADRTQSAAQHRVAAETAEAAGDWHAAVVERMRAVARELEERGILDTRPGRTALEIASEAGAVLRTQTEVVPVALRAAATTFDDIVYGGRPADAAAARRVRDADDVLRRNRSGVRRELASIP